MNLVSYIRVSKVGGRAGDSFQSPTQQRQAIKSIVALTPGARISTELEDLDESGGSMDRPGVRQAIELVESGQADGIVVAYLDRWARTLETLEMIERWAQEGKTFVSARERFDATTSEGKFALGMMLLVAEYYRDQITERWDDSCRGAIERGVHVTVPFGYRREGGERGRPLVIFEPEATIVRRIFTERLQGTGIAAIAEHLNADGILSPRSGRWTRQSVRALLRVRAYVGEASRGEYTQSDAHQAIVGRHEWEAVQQERARTVRNGESLLGGLVRCAGCGYVMGAGDNGRGLRRYNCNRHHAEMRCPSPTTAPADAVEQFVTDEFLARYGSVSVQGGSSADPAIADSERALERARTEYAKWRDDADLRGVIGDEDYRAGLIARKQAVTTTELAFDDAVRQANSATLSVSDDLWTTLDVAERRELLRAGVDAVVLSRASSTRTPLVDRVELVWAGELENDGSRSGVAASVRGRP